MAESTSILLQTLVGQNKLTEKQAADLQQQLSGDASVQELLIDGGFVDGEELAKILAEQYEVPYVSLAGVEIPPSVREIIPESTARGHLIIAYAEEESVLRVAMADPADRQIVEFIRKKVDKPVEAAVASVGAIRAALGGYRVSLQADLQDIINKELKNVSKKTDDLSEQAEDLPTIRITQAILTHAITEGASDIHIEPTEKNVIVRYRIDGILRDELTLPKAVMAGIVARIKVLSSLKIDEHRLPQDGRFKLEAEDYKVAFRVSTLPVYDGEKVVMRLLDESGKGLGLDDVGMGEKQLTGFRRAISNPNGMILVTGPTGSGKTTTLYASMKELNTPDVNISTIEDPIEYRMPRINQTQVKPEIGLTFANGLRALVRQDPDIIMVGEIRDEETAALAVNAALTGHLVLSTLHTNSAAGALPRLRDMSVEAFLLASTLNVVLAQRLVRKLCAECRTERKVDESILADLKKEMDTDALLSSLKSVGVVNKEQSWEEVSIFEAGECHQCREGYKGRIGIYEVLEVTEEIQALITPSTSSQELEDAAREHTGMISLFEDGLAKVVTGVTSLEEVLRVARE